MKISASELQAAVKLQAAVIITDGKYDDWQALFMKMLNASARALKAKFTSEWLKPVKKVHTLELTFKGAGIDSSKCLLKFQETKVGYKLSEVILRADGQYPQVHSGDSIANGKDLRDLILADYMLDNPKLVERLDVTGLFTVWAHALDGDGNFEEDVNLYVRAKSKAGAKAKAASFLDTKLVDGFLIKDVSKVDNVEELVREGMISKRAVDAVDRDGGYIYDQGT